MALLVRLGVLLPLVGKKFLPGGIADYFLSLQTVCLALDLLSYLSGDVRFNLRDFVLEVARKSFVMYSVVYSHPIVARSEFFSILILTWGLQELIKYIYFGYKLKSQNTKKIPFAVSLAFTRGFVILAPVRLGCEFSLTFISLKYMELGLFKNCVRFMLMGYIPLAFIMFGKSLRRKLRLDLKKD